MPLEYYWEQERDVKVTEEGRKAQTSILRAQQTAHERYQMSMVSLPVLEGPRALESCQGPSAVEIADECALRGGWIVWRLWVLIPGNRQIER